MTIAAENFGFLREPADLYHAMSQNRLTSHSLADFRRCPLLYHKKKLGLIKEEESTAYLIGRALHTLVLEGRNTFDSTFVVGGPVNPKTGELYGVNTKAYTEWVAAQGKPVLSPSQFNLIWQMAQSVHSHSIAHELLSNGVAEGVVRSNYRGVPCQARIDYFNPQGGIIDLKSCDDLTWFEADARRFGYANQLAFYRALVSRALNLNPAAYLVAVEKKEPYRCGVWRLADALLTQAQEENEAAIDRLQLCTATDVWPTDFEECRIFAVY